MASKTILSGNLGRDPELRRTKTGTAAAGFSVGTNEHFNGEDETEWHRLKAFGAVAEYCERNLKQGDLVYVEGRNRTRHWEGDDGQRRSVTEILVSHIEKLRNGPGHSNNARKPAPRRAKKAASQAALIPPDSDFDDDIPF